MKSIIAMMLLLIGLSASSQIRLENVRFDAHIYTEPQHFISIGDWKGDGFNIGAGIEYQSNIVYVKAQTYYFPDLKGIDYLDLGGAFGFNWQSHMRYWRTYIGFTGGRIWRNGTGDYAYLGAETGIDYYFNGYMGNGLFMGIQSSVTSSTDSKYYSNDETITRWNVGLRIGYTF